MNRKRSLLAASFGFLMGVIFYLGSRSCLDDDISGTMLVYILINRIIIGFAFGIYALRMPWALHGLLMGLVVGLPFTAGFLLEQNHVETAITAFILSGIYGFLIELFTSVVFKASPQHAAEKFRATAPQPSRGLYA